MSMMSMDERGGEQHHFVSLEQKMFNTGPQATKALPIAQSLNGSSSGEHNNYPINSLPPHHQPQQHNIVSGGGGQATTMATGDTGHAGNVTYMQTGMLNAPGVSSHQYLSTNHQIQHHSTPSTSMLQQHPSQHQLLQQQQNLNGNGSTIMRSSPTNDMNQCLQPVSEDSIDGTLREFAPVHHLQHMHHIQQQQQYSMQQMQGPPTPSYQQTQQQHLQHLQQHNQYQQNPVMYTQQAQPQNQQQQLQNQPQQTTSMQHINESSNLSSAGSISDREPEQGGTPNRPVAPQSSTTTEKKARKRRRIGGEDGHATPKQERKITEFINKQHSQASPKSRSNLQQTGNVSNGSNSYGAGGNGNGSGTSNDHTSIAQQHDVYWTMTNNHRATPTPTQQQQHYSSSDSNSNSNQSPPGQRMVRMIDEETQTEAGTQSNASSADEIAKRDRVIDDFRRQIDELQAKFSNERRKNEASKETIKRLLIEKNFIERKSLRDKTTADTPRIGCFKTMRTGDSFRDQWTDGYAFDELEKKQQNITAERNEIVNASALLKKRKPLGIGKEGTKRSAANSLNLDASTNGMQPSTSSTANGDDAIFRRPEEPKEINYQEYIELDEIYKLRREHLKKEEMDLQIEREKLDRERQLHIRELKRASNESASTYKDHSLLNKRYLMLCLLGKGGFSEVWKAFDIEENRYVACKIHHVNKDWKEEKKANYVKHAMREKDIHKSLDHCRIVKLYDLFTIDNHSFCTVLEYCPGNDLDFYLKQNKQISEKEARSIIMQVVSALVYLNEKKDPIIHYDLKPANILLESGNACGAIKITDFGLSKIMEGSEADNDHDGIELTSQFAGTYWYLPPETFIVPPPKITCKVDVWSIGVIFYQCIYGKKPFGNELTQQKILEYNTIINAREVSFPAKPPVSPVAQDFIRRCLQYKKEERADVFELAKHELFRPRGATRSSAAGSINSPSIPRSPSVNREDDA
ncbi:unnamed protein product [Caenorhabditis angaria]|uniref:Protein kinase domain-containing protein n=1 Tax=Caenorhabditis angaria TaxID=860376 RepID=A0A9P1II94_9PELO|nr:unnamed protein product [Caenorhabditis angaria]